MYKIGMFKKMAMLSTLAMGAGMLAAEEPVKKDKKMSKEAFSAKIAVVDVRGILTQDPKEVKTSDRVSHEWRDQFVKLQETLQPVNQEIAELNAQYQAKMKEFEQLQKSGVASQESLREKYQKELAPLEYKLQGQSQQVQRFTYDEIGRIQSMVGPKIQKAADQISKKQGWDFVMARDALVSTLSADARFDITDEVLAIINTDYALDKAAAKPAAAPAA